MLIPLAFTNSCTKTILTKDCRFEGYFDFFENPCISAYSKNGELLINKEITSLDKKSLLITTDDKGEVKLIKVFHPNGNVARIYEKTETSKTQNGGLSVSHRYQCYDRNGDALDVLSYNKLFKFRK